MKNDENRPWLVTIITIMAGIVIVAGCYKVPPTMVPLMKEMNINVGEAGWLMSLLSLVGIILALPAGAIMIKTGPKKLGVFSIACALCGNIIGAVAPNFAILLLSRVAEGIGFGLMSVVAPAIIAVLFPPQKRGLPMAIFSTWMGVGILVIFTLTNAVVPVFGWRGDWWLATVLCAVMLILFVLFVQVPKPETADGGNKELPAEVSLGKGLKFLPSWLLCLTFAGFSYGVSTITTFAPTFLVEEVHLDMATANMYSSVLTLGMIAGGIIMGFILGIVRNRPVFLSICMIITAIFMFFTFKVTQVNLIMPFMIALGLVYSMVPAVLFTVAPEAAVSPATMGVTMGILLIGQNLGGSIAPVLIGSIVQNSGGVWDSASWTLLCIGLISVVATILFIAVMGKKATQKELGIRL